MNQLLKFKKIESEDLKILQEYFKKRDNRFCDYTIASIFMWKDEYHMEYSIVDQTLYIKELINGVPAFFYPIGKNANLDLIFSHCDHNNLKKVVTLVTDEGLTYLDNNYQIMFINHNRDWSDYFYSKDSLLNLTGKKYSTPRNHINKFNSTYTNVKVTSINNDNIQKVIEFFNIYRENYHKNSDSFEIENQGTLKVLNHFFELGLLGMVVYVDEQIVGFSVGEIINDTIYIDIEKADVQYHGVYPFISNQFLKMYASSDTIEYVNREEDDGDEGLRKSKNAYRPLSLLNKYVVEVK